MRSQAPSERQLRYKEKVTELRRKRNSSLNKEQKEKYMVTQNLMLALLPPFLELLYDVLKIYLLSLSTPAARITATATEQAGSRC